MSIGAIYGQTDQEGCDIQHYDARSVDKGAGPHNLEPRALYIAGELMRHRTGRFNPQQKTLGVKPQLAAFCLR